MKVQSAGFIIRSKDGKYLLGLSEFKGNRTWTVFKGQQEEGETLIETAIRELEEETSVDVNNNKNLQMSISTNPVYSYSLKNKDIYLFLLDDRYGELDNFEFKCKSFTKEGDPEIIDYKWFEVDDIEEAVFYSQRGIIEYLKNSLT